MERKGKRTLGHRRRGKLAIRHAAMASLVFLAAVSCAEDDPAGLAPTRRLVTSVSVSPATATLSSPGDTLRLTAEALDHLGNAVAGAEFSWASSDGSVVTVDVGGLVTAVSGGTARVMVREGSSRLSATALVVVADEPRDALLDVYAAMGGSGWTHSENWGTDAPLGTWYGVTTDERSRIIELDLSDNGLTGPVPPELARLATLVVLDLSGNGASAASQLDPDNSPSPGPSPGPSPDAGLDATLLKPMAVPSPVARHPPAHARGVEEGLTGPIPPELGALSKLRTLNLSGNSLTGRIPPELVVFIITDCDTISYGLSRRFPYHF